ncbi:beta strand repeat-containing protein [Spongiibacter marinus]|uniref:beta strand repeat-containing protein n=1 Tax=Spongiibacter marinus TaxID=354246 RepID=UPI00356803BE
MKKQGTREQITVDVDTTAVDTLSAELAAAVAPQAELETAPVEGLFDDEKKLEEEVALSEGAIQTEAVEVAAADNGVAAMILADTNAQSSGGASTGGSSGGSVPTGVWIGAGVLGAAAIVAASDDDDDDNGGSKSSTPANRAPEAAASQAVSVDEGDSTVISINATDADGDSLTYSPTQPANGQLAVNGSNQFTYTPDAGFSGTDSFDVVISDGKTSITQTVNITVDPAGNGGTPGAYQLTSGTDIATADVFDAPMVFVPDGSDRILSLQDEDVLTGTAGKTDNTLNVTMGNANADEGTTGVVTPKLINIQNINIDWTGNTTTLDLRNSDSTQKINIDRVTQDAGSVLVDNIGTPAGDLRVSDSASDNVNVLFRYKQGVLTDGNAPARELDIELDDVLANAVMQNARGAGAAVEGFETVNLNATNGVDINNFTVNEMESLIVTGNGNLDIVSLTPVQPVTSTEYMLLGAPGINNPAAVGLLNLDGTAFAGDMNIDISSSLGGFADPSNSGAIVHGVVTGGAGDDTFYTSNSVAATSASNRDVIDGGTGDNTLVLTTLNNPVVFPGFPPAPFTPANIAGNASINNIQTLEMRQQGMAVQSVDFDAFDAALNNVVMRGEVAGGSTFNLVDLGATLAENGLTLRHGISGSTAPTVNAQLKDATGNNTIAITVENDLNTQPVFNYTLNFDGDNLDGDSDLQDARVENVTIHDNDTESNTVTLTKAQEHTGTITLDGGVAGQTYTVANPLVAKVIEASAQKSDLRLTVGDNVPPTTTVDQDIRLGSGDDILTFMNIDDFTGGDKISDAGGNDTVRAAFSKDSDLSLTGIENLHIIANENVTLGMAGADVDNLVILANIAADGDADASPLTPEPFVVGGVQTTDVITLTDTKLTELNFSADLDKVDLGNNPNDGFDDNESFNAVFNGVTLQNNSANALTVNINSALDFVDAGAQSYTLGQLTAHGVTGMDIKVADEDVESVISAFNSPMTTINNIYAKDMASLSVSAQGDVNLGVVSGAPLNNSLNSFDSTAVGGDVTARVISLGNNATVSLGNGDNNFDALGSAGNSIKIVAGNGDNMIQGSAQSDRITTGSGWDMVAGDRGNNVINTGAGNDTIQAKDGNDTYDVGTGIDSVVDNKGTNINANLATTTVALGGGVTSVQLYTDGGAIVATTDQMLAVGDGSNLSVRWTGDNLQTASAVLDGKLAEVDANTTTANADLSIYQTAGNYTFNGGVGNDVAMWNGSSANTDGLAFNGGAGNDAAVGSDGNDTFNGGIGADKYVMQDDSTPDGMIDSIVIADGESTASAWDVVVGFDTSLASVLGTAAGANVVGGDVLDLASTLITAPVGVTDGIDAGAVRAHQVGADGLVTFSNHNAFVGGADMVGTGAGQLSLTDALSYLAANLNGSNETVAFQYDADGDGFITAVDSTFVFQDGATDTVVELVGAYTGIEAVGTGTVGVIEIG